MAKYYSQAEQSMDIEPTVNEEDPKRLCWLVRIYELRDQRITGFELPPAKLNIGLFKNGITLNTLVRLKSSTALPFMVKRFAISCFNVLIFMVERFAISEFRLHKFLVRSNSQILEQHLTILWWQRFWHHVLVKC